MIKEVSINEIPGILRNRETATDIEEFLNSDMKCCEIEVRNSTAEKTRGRYYVAAKKRKAPIHFAVRGERVFMFKEGV